MSLRTLSPRNLVIIAAGLYLAMGFAAGFVTANALLVLCLGIYRFRLDRSRLAVIVAALALIVLIMDHFLILAVNVLAALFIYYLLSRKSARDNGIPSVHRLVHSLKLDEPSWVLKPMSYWHAIGQVRMDLSLAVPEEEETVIILKGLLGDADLTIPEDYGLEIDASVLIGQIGFGQAQDGGMLQRLVWRSPDYEQRAYKVKLQLFYLVGDIKIRTV